MPVTSAVCLLAALAAVAVGAWLGGVEGSGAIAGGLLAASLGGALGVGQRAWLRDRPNLAMGALGLFFLVKLVVAGVAALAVRFVPYLAERFDLAAFLLAYAAAIVAVLFASAYENARWVVRTQGPSTAPRDPRLPATGEVR